MVWKHLASHFENEQIFLLVLHTNSWKKLLLAIHGAPREVKIDIESVMSENASLAFRISIYHSLHDENLITPSCAYGPNH